MSQPTAFPDAATTALNDLLAGLGASGWRNAAPVQYSGQPPEFGSRHRLVTATAAALGAAAAGAAQRWFRATGTGQDIAIDALHAACGLCPNYFQRQNGKPVPPLGLQRELKAGFYPTADGRWFYITGSYSHLRDGALQVLDCANNVEAITRATSRRQSFDMEEAFAAAGLTGIVPRSAEEWRAHPQGAQLARTAVITLEKIGDSAPEAPRARRRPLDDIRVIDAAHVIAGPTAARTLGEHGAQVLRVSSPLQPDPLLQLLDTGIGKRNAYIDLHDAADADTLRGLVRSADVFVQSWKPASLDRLGFGPQQLAALRPGLVYLSVSAFGDGVWAERKGFDQIAQAATGIAITEAGGGGAGKPKLVPTHLLNDFISGYLGAAGVLAALERRATEGGSWHVKVSLARTGMWVQDLGLRTPGPDTVHIDQLTPRLVSHDSPFGIIERMDPVARLSATPAHWTLPPAPLGAHMPVWLG